MDPILVSDTSGHGLAVYAHGRNVYLGTRAFSSEQAKRLISALEDSVSAIERPVEPDQQRIVAVGVDASGNIDTETSATHDGHGNPAIVSAARPKHETVWKYELDITDHRTLLVPAGAEFLSAQMQNGKLCVWARVDANQPGSMSFLRHIWIVGTGNPMPGNPVRHIDTVQDGSFVWHVFEETA